MDFLSILIYIGKFIAFQYLSEKLAPKPQAARAQVSGLKDLSFPTADPTRPHPWLVGKCLLDSPNLFATYDFRAQERSKSVRSGWFSSTDVPLPTEYYVSAGMVLCAGTGVVLHEIWAEDVRIWSGTAHSGDSIYLDYTDAQSAASEQPVGIRGMLDFHSGSETPNAYLESKRGAGNTPAWPHLTYAVLRGRTAAEVPSTLALLAETGGGAWIGTSTVVQHLKFVCSRAPFANAANSLPNGDANPAFAIQELMQDRQVWAGMSPQLGPDNATSAQVLFDEEHGVSFVCDSERTAEAVIDEICRQISGTLQHNHDAAVLTLRLLRETDEPVLTLDDSNIKSVDEFGRASLGDATNALSVSYTARDDKYRVRKVEVQDLAAIDAVQKVTPGTTSYLGIRSAKIAHRIAMRDLRALSAPLAACRVTAIIPQRQSLTPGDIVQFSSVANDISARRMRCTSANYASPGQALCELELVDDVFTAGASTYAAPAIVDSSVMSEPPGVVGWSLFEAGAPVALGGVAGEVHLLYAAGAPAAFPERASSYTLAYFDAAEVRVSDTATWAPSSTKFAARGTIAATSTALAPGATGSFDMDVSAADAYTISRNAGRQCLALCGTEYIVCSVSVTGLTATVTVTARGQFGTSAAASLPAGSEFVYLLYGYVVDSKALSTSEDPSNPGALLAAETVYVRARTVGVAGLGPFDSVDQATDAAVLTGSGPL